MKLRVLALLLALATVLSGCQLIRDDYSNSWPHMDSTSQTAQTLSVSNGSQMRAAILTQVRSGAQDISITATSYEGDFRQDYADAVDFVTHSSPACAYMVESISQRITGEGTYGKVDMLVAYRHTAEEADNAPDVNILKLEDVIRKATGEWKDTVVLKYSGAPGMDFKGFVRDYYESHLTQVMVPPRVSVSEYPPDAETRYVELRFSYGYKPTDLKYMQTAVEILINTAASSVKKIPGQTDRANALYAFLSEEHTYYDTSYDAPAYTLLWKGEGDSLAYAAVFREMCDMVNLECRMVKGERDGEPYYWNILTTEAGNRHVDLYADRASGLSFLQFLTDDQMAGYRWDAAQYGECVAPVIVEETGEMPEEAPPAEPEPQEPAQPEAPPEPEPPQPEEPSETEENFS